MKTGRCLAGLALAALLASCSGETQPAPGDVPAFDGIAEGETITALGTEPFWSAKIAGTAMTYSTPDNIDGTEIEVSRFAGNGGLGFSGMLNGEPLLMAVTPGECSDQMSDRTYPFTVTFNIGEAQLVGCAYTDQQNFIGEENP
ncbi:COG3650 family protein [Altererythrobacter litoralis]|uniref:Lipoprotein n=1 Tax=Altererythrobacter litoralis TaxID=3113904 RepID=A0ABU7GDN2_9SPHN|nr:hypothetical protein [Erythrobacteraceae bacterium 1XM1-14]